MPILGDGQIFERYRIIRWLGSSSTGESYEAEDHMLLRKVTFKLIHPWATLPDAARRQFFREMQGISSLNHPHLAAVLDYGEIDGRLYVARRYTSSGSLLGSNGRLWYRPPLAVADAFTYAHQLAQVLQYIHQHGYLHGSLTFTNVLVLRGPGREQETDHAPFLVADIGLTNFVRRFGSHQVEALPVSTAPEQLSKRVTPSSDQFALAVLLYFWLAGRPPYLGTPAEVEKLKLTETITPLSSLNPGITPEQDSIILRALAAYPEKRYPSVLAFTEALKSSQPASTASFNTFPAQLETPRTPLHIVIDEFSPEQATDTLAKLPNSSRKDAEEQSSSPLDATSQPAESYHPAQEELLSIPQTEAPKAEGDPSTEQAHSLPIQESAILPTLPETPRLEEGVIQIDFAPSLASEESAALASEPAARPVEAISQIEEKPVVSEQSVPLVEAISTPEGAQIDSSQPFPRGEDSGAISERQVTEINPNASNVQPVVSNSTGTLPRLIVFSPYTNSPYEYILAGAEVNIGRAGASDLRLEMDDLTSRHHALLKREGERVLIFDKRSYNGVFINGQQIEVGRGYELTDGDHIGIGSYELIFRSALGSRISQAS